MINENFNFEITNYILQMYCFNNLLNDKWKIYKKNEIYVLKKNKEKIIVPKMTNNAAKKVYNEQNTKENIEDLKYILKFLFNALENNWIIEKNNSNYIFSKKHEGKKEYFSDDYIATFIKQNFS